MITHLEPDILECEVKWALETKLLEVTNRLKGLDLVDRVHEELWTEVRNTVQEVVTKAIPPKKKCEKAK